MNWKRYLSWISYAIMRQTLLKKGKKPWQLILQA